MQLKLYCFRICPFVERVNIVLNATQLSCERIYVDIRNKPDWFLKISPFGKVPILKIEDKIIFESNVIIEFLDNIASRPSLHPADPVTKAFNGSFIEYSTNLLFDAYFMLLVKNQDEFLEKEKLFKTKLSYLEQHLTEGPFFNGNQFHMIDIMYAPLMRRFEFLNKCFNINLLADFPKCQNWAKHIFAKEIVQKGFVTDFDEEYENVLVYKESFLVTNATA